MRVVSPLRARLGLIALLAVFPAVGVIAYIQLAERATARERTHSMNLRLARLAASQQAGMLDGVARFLATIAEFPPLAGDRAEGCNELLPKLLRDHPGYFNIAVVNADGSIFCS